MVLFPYLASLTDTNSEEWVCLGSPLLFPPWSIQSSTDNVNFYHLWVLFLWGNNNNSNKKWNQSRSCEKNLWRELWSSFTPAGYETHREKRAACDSKTMPKRKTFLPLLAKKSFRHRQVALIIMCQQNSSYPNRGTDSISILQRVEKHTGESINHGS